MIFATALGLALVFVVPAEALWRDWYSAAPRSQARRFGATIAKALTLLVALAAVAKIENLTAADLGIGTQLGRGGYVGLAIAAFVIAGLAMATLFAKPKQEKISRHRAATLMPEGPRELRLFFVMVPLIGFSWEVLYRGYLLWWLAPLVGMPAAVIVASISYGLAHGWKSFRESSPSIVAALALTIGYAVTGSLWWLIIVHTGLPLIGFIATRRAAAIGSHPPHLLSTHSCH